MRFAIVGLLAAASMSLAVFGAHALTSVRVQRTSSATSPYHTAEARLDSCSRIRQLGYRSANCG